MSIAAIPPPIPQTVFIGFNKAPNPVFDIEYYGTTHFAIIEKNWKDDGLLNWNVVSFIEDATAPFHVIAEIVWKDTASATAAMLVENPKRAEILADGPNFTNLNFTLFTGPQTAHSDCGKFCHLRHV